MEAGFSQIQSHSYALCKVSTKYVQFFSHVNEKIKKCHKYSYLAILTNSLYKNSFSLIKCVSNSVQNNYFT